MRKILVTEDDVRDALGPVTAYSPLANALIRTLFGRTNKSAAEFDARLTTLEKQIKKLSKGKKK